MSTQLQTRQWYEQYYRRKGATRNDVLLDRGVLFQQLAFEVSITNSLRRAELNRTTAKILDVGCGGGGSLQRFFQMGFRADYAYGIDILEERIDEGRRRLPQVNFTCGDAADMPYEGGFFDLITESTMFVQLTDPKFSRNVAAEMLRVVRPGGYLLLIDWRYSKPGSREYLGLSRRRIRQLFEVERLSRIICRSNGALVPPLGRTLSKYVPWLYFLTAAVLPVLVGQNCTLLRKRQL